MDKKDKDIAQGSASGVDPDLEKKVDEMMSVEVPEKLAAPAPEPTLPSSAPLLPSDKLPKFEDKKISPVDVETAEPQTIVSPDQAASEEPSVEDTIGIEDPATDYAVDEIVAEESNQILADEDLKAAIADAPEPKKGFFGRLFSWWHKPLYRHLFILLILAAIASAAILPTSRYFLLNSFGVRSSSSLVVIDQKTKQPLKNVEVSLSGQTAKTDITGLASFSGIKLGDQKIIINKPAFAEVDMNVVIGWGSNPLGDIELRPIGSQYTFRLTDFLSDKPILVGEIVSGESSAVLNKNGEATLTLPNSDETEVEVQVTAKNYRTENLKLPVSTKDTKDLKMVPSRKSVFISKRTGTYDLYKIDLDGKNEEKILEGTDTESEDNMALVSHPERELAALVSTRGIEKSKNGSLLSSLTLVDIDSKNTETVTSAEAVQLIGWSGPKLVYVETAHDVEEDDKYKNKIISFDVDTGEKKELASSNYFNDVLLAGDFVLFAPAEFAVNGRVGLYKINPDASNKLTIYDKEIWSLNRVNYDKVSVSASDVWYDFNINQNSFVKAGAPPASQKSRIYIDNSEGTKSLWVDERDGKGVLLVLDIGQMKDTVIKSAGGIKQPVRWIDNEHVIYRTTSGETADYVISLSGGEPKKISDVTNVAGIDRWYYY